MFYSLVLQTLFFFFTFVSCCHLQQKLIMEFLMVHFLVPYFFVHLQHEVHCYADSLLFNLKVDFYILMNLISYVMKRSACWAQYYITSNGSLVLWCSYCYKILFFLPFSFVFFWLLFMLTTSVLIRGWFVQLNSKVKAEDPDADTNGQIKYSIDFGNSDGYFSLDEDTGEVTLAKTIPLADNKILEFNLYVTARDGRS